MLFYARIDVIVDRLLCNKDSGSDPAIAVKREWEEGVSVNDVSDNFAIRQIRFKCQTAFCCSPFYNVAACIPDGGYLFLQPISTSTTGKCGSGFLSHALCNLC